LKLGYDEPRAIPARPPIRTISTLWATSVSRIRFGRNSQAETVRGPAISEDEIREVGAVVDPLGDRPFEVSTDERSIVAVVDWPRGEFELLAEDVEEVRERAHGGADDVTLDAGDGSLRRTPRAAS
jgi:hypothetical protein